MKIKALKTAVGLTFKIHKGGEYNLPDEIAQSLINGGLAEEIKETKSIGVKSGKKSN
jgi:hypothetical protein